MLQCYRGMVEGRVQGVYFRASMRRQAQQLGVTGWVRNCSDGNVEWFICAEESVIQSMLAWLEHGPSQASVTALRSEGVDCPVEPMTSFDIRQ